MTTATNAATAAGPNHTGGPATGLRTGRGACLRFRFFLLLNQPPAVIGWARIHRLVNV